MKTEQLQESKEMDWDKIEECLNKESNTDPSDLECENTLVYVLLNAETYFRLIKQMPREFYDTQFNIDKLMPLLIQHKCVRRFGFLLGITLKRIKGNENLFSKFPELPEKQPEHILKFKEILVDYLSKYEVLEEKFFPSLEAGLTQIWQKEQKYWGILNAVQNFK